MDKSYHWINNSVKIDFALPSMIQELVDELEEMDRKEDWSYFDRCGFIENITKRTYGKLVGHPADLNMGDCFAYACAKVYGAQLLYKGRDFSETDLA